MNLSEYKNIWILAEHKDGVPLPVYYELLSKAKELVGKSRGTKVCGIVLGYGVNHVIEKVAASGVDIVYSVDHAKLKNYNCDYYAKMLEAMIKTYKPEGFLIGATSVGSELAPTIAAKVKTGVAAHCVDVTINDNGNLVCMVPAFGGKIVSEILVPNHRPQIASVRPGILSASKIAANANVEIIKCDSSVLDTFDSGITLVDFMPNKVHGQKLDKADIVVVAGRGVSTKEGWEHIQELAKRLNAPIGNTRNFIDNGFVTDESTVIGTSGKSIKPKVCLAFGASGAMHFVCGILKSKMIISVNRDENAKLFDMSDYKVVSDADKIIQALIHKLG